MERKEKRKRKLLTISAKCIATQKLFPENVCFTLGKVYTLIPLTKENIYGVINDCNIYTWLSEQIVNECFSNITYNGVIYKDIKDCRIQLIQDALDNCVVDNEDKVNHPKHYTWLKEKCGIEVIDITRHMGFDLGNAIKYILRNGHKSEQGYSDKEKAIEDLKKAIWYINDEIKTLEDGN